VRFLVDANLPRSVVASLRSLGYDAELARERNDKSRTELAQNFSEPAAPFGEFSSSTFHGAPHKEKLKVVCGPCNNGWMSSLESASKFLMPLAKSEPITLGAEARRAIAQWTVLKLPVVDFHPIGAGGSYPVFSEKDRVDFKSSLKIPEGVYIWIARAGGPLWEQAFSLTSGRLLLSPKALSANNLPPFGPQRNVQSVTWGIGDLLIHTFSITNRHLDAIGSSGPPDAGRLWPLTSGDITWPQMAALTDFAVDAVASIAPRPL
jgi:hypothetical protein